MGNLEVRIEVAVDTNDEIRELVRLAADIQKSTAATALFLYIATINDVDRQIRFAVRMRSRFHHQ